MLICDDSELDEKLKNLPRKISTIIYYYYSFLLLSFFLSFEIKLFKRCYLRTRHEKKPIEDAFYAEQRSKREHKNQSSSRGQAKGSIVAILASKLLSLSPRLYIQFHLPRRLPSSSAHLSLVFNRKVECMEREEKEKKYIFIYLEESFAFILTTGQGSSTVKKKGIKNEEISIFAPGSTNVKSNFRHWNSKEGFSISRSFFFFPPQFFFSIRNYSFVPLDLSFWSLLSIGLHVVSDQPVFLFSADTNGWREIASLSRTLGKLERFAIIDFPPFFPPSFSPFFPSHPHIVASSFRGFFFSPFFPLFFLIQRCSLFALSSRGHTFDRQCVHCEKRS